MGSGPARALILKPGAINACVPPAFQPRFAASAISREILETSELQTPRLLQQCLQPFALDCCPIAVENRKIPSDSSHFNRFHDFNPWQNCKAKAVNSSISIRESTEDFDPIEGLDSPASSRDQVAHGSKCSTRTGLPSAGLHNVKASETHLEGLASVTSNCFP